MPALVAALVVLSLVVAFLLRRTRRLSRRLEELSDRSIEWRLRLGRNQEELAAEVERLRSHAGLPSTAAGGAAAAPARDEPLLQIRSRR